MKFLCIKVVFYLILLFLGFYPGWAGAQNFKTNVVIGFNASQLDGDNLLGFNKLGLHGGIRVSYDLGKKGWATELLFHQKGSTESLSFGTRDELQSITLNYLSVPFLFYFNEWHDDYLNIHKIRIEGGIMANALFSVNSTNSFFDNAEDDFRKYDFGITGGLSYRMSRKTSLTFRYERSFLKIYQDPIFEIRGLQSYLLNFRLEIHLNPDD